MYWQKWELGRNRYAERRERWRYRVLERVYQNTGDDCEFVVNGERLAQSMSSRREDVLAALDYLVENGFLADAGAGPRFRISPKGVRYLQKGAWRRSSIRE